MPNDQVPVCFGGNAAERTETLRGCTPRPPTDHAPTPANTSITQPLKPWAIPGATVKKCTQKRPGTFRRCVRCAAGVSKRPSTKMTSTNQQRPTSKSKQTNKQTKSGTKRCHLKIREYQRRVVPNAQSRCSSENAKQRLVTPNTVLAQKVQRKITPAATHGNTPFAQAGHTRAPTLRLKKFGRAEVRHGKAVARRA